MEEVTRKRLMRKLERLPEEQLYQVVDFIEFLEAKYAREAARKPDAFQQFAERVEDQMRIRALAPKAMKGTMRVMSTAGKVIDGVRELGRDLVRPPEGRSPNGAGAAGRSGTPGDRGGAAERSAGPGRAPAAPGPGVAAAGEADEAADPGGAGDGSEGVGSQQGPASGDV